MSVEPKSSQSQPRKRARKTISCLECRRRRAKCNKELPCGTCVGRGEPQLCSYAEGVLPAASTPMSQASIPFSRQVPSLPTLSRSVSAIPTPSRLAEPSVPPTSSCQLSSAPDGRVEKVAQTLDVMFIGSEHKGPSTISDTQQQQFWPSIFLPHDKLASTNRKKWIRDYDEVLSSLPSADVIGFLVDHLFSPNRPWWHVIFEPPFRLELAQLQPALDAGLRCSIDPAWLAMLLALLSISCNDIVVNERLPNDTPALANVDFRKMCDDLFEAFESALRCADWLVRPQMRVLNALLIYLWLYCDGPSPEGKGSLLDLWFQIAAGISKSLSLHQLGDSSGKSLPVDPMLPIHLPVLARQMACRAFNTVYIFDTFSSNRSSVAKGEEVIYNFPEGSFTTEEPQNYSDDDLMSDFAPRPRPLYEKTPSVWEVHGYKLAKHWRMICDHVYQLDSLTYDWILDCDRKLRIYYQDFVSLAINNSVNVSGKGYHRIFDLLNSSYQQRLIRLHRPCFLSSYESEQALFSQNAIIGAARTMMLSHRRLISEGWLIPECLYTHHLSAATVLFIHAFKSPGQTEQCRQELQISYDLHIHIMRKAHSPLRRTARRGQRIVGTMLKMLSSPRDPNASIQSTLETLIESASRPEIQALPTTSLQQSFAGQADGWLSTTSTPQDFLPPYKYDDPSMNVFGDGVSYNQDALAFGQDSAESSPALVSDWESFVRGFSMPEQEVWGLMQM